MMGYDHDAQQKSEGGFKGMDANKSQLDTDIPSEQVMKLIEQIEYKEGSFVTKTIIENESGTCKLAAFDRGQGRGEHTAPFNALVYLLEGKAEIVVSGKSHHLEQGEMIKIPANEPHALRALTKLKLMSVMIKP
jgi:quercetin dioxygenase-like cupin family protein